MLVRQGVVDALVGLTSNVKEVCLMEALLLWVHNLCELLTHASSPNIQMQKTGAGVIFHAQEGLPASDLERSKDHETGE